MRSLILILLFAVPTLAANHFILDGGTGDGTAWDNALDNLPAVLVRGDTYYIGDGEYGITNGYNFNDAESGTTVITIKKATAADHGTETGWAAGYGDGQAIWTQITTNYTVWGFPNDYYVIDGQTGGGPGAWTTGHGFKVIMVGTAATVRYGINFGTTGSSFATVGDHITISHVEVEGPGADFTGATDHRVFRSSYTGDLLTFVGPDSVTIDHCYIHDLSGKVVGMVNPGDFTWEYNAIVDQTSRWGTEFHAEPIEFHGSSGTNTFRYSLFENCGGSAAIALKRNYDLYDTGTIAVYGNVFYTTAAWAADTTNHVGYGEGIVSMVVSTTTGGWSDNPVNACYFYNNTIVGVNGNSHFASGIHLPHVETCVIANNLWMNCTNLDGTAGNIGFNYHDHAPTVDYNLYINTVNSAWAEPYTAAGFVSAGAHDLLHESTDPFTDYAALDFSLTARSATIGDTLAAPYATDWIAATRGDDGFWDVGAIELTEGAPPANFPPVLNGMATQTGTVGSAFTYTVLATDANAGDTMTYSVLNPPSWMSLNTGTGAITGTPTGAGVFEITFSVSDGTATDTNTMTITVYTGGTVYGIF